MFKAQQSFKLSNGHRHASLWCRNAITSTCLNLFSINQKVSRAFIYEPHLPTPQRGRKCWNTTTYSQKMTTNTPLGFSINGL